MTPRDGILLSLWNGFGPSGSRGFHVMYEQHTHITIHLYNGDSYLVYAAMRRRLRDQMATSPVLGLVAQLVDVAKSWRDMPLFGTPPCRGAHNGKLRGNFRSKMLHVVSTQNDINKSQNFSCSWDGRRRSSTPEIPTTHERPSTRRCSASAPSLLMLRHHPLNRSKSLQIRTDPQSSVVTSAGTPAPLPRATWNVWDPGRP